MAEYINREALTIENLEKYMTVMKVNTKEYGQQVVVAIDDLMYLPAADVAEVVRCRDCKFYNKKTGFCLNYSYFKDSDGMSCSPADSPDFTFFNEDDFCSYGAKKGR